MILTYPKTSERGPCVAVRNAGELIRGRYSSYSYTPTYNTERDISGYTVHTEYVG